MKKIFALAVALLFFGAGIAYAESYRAELNASNSAIYAGLDAKQYVTQGYMKYGGSGVFVDTSTKEFGLFNIKLMVGSETLFQNLYCEVGFKGILGSVEERNHDGSIGAAAFSGNAAFRLPENISPIPVVFSLGVAASPGPLTFLDSKSYFDVKTAAEVYIVDNAALQISYRYYSLDIKDWEFKDDLLMLGIVLEF